MELLDSARRGELDKVKVLIQQGAHVNTKNRSGQTPLYCACENGHTDVAQYLLDNGASVDLGAKPLIAAVRYNHYDCAKLLLQYNANVHCTNTKLETPISVALQKGNSSIIFLLLQYNAVSSPLLSDSAIQLLNCAKLEHTKTIQKLIDDKVIDLRSENTFLAAFSFAFERGSLQFAERMLLDDSYPKIEQLFSDAAYYSAKNNWPSVLSKLIKKGVDMNSQTGGQTPLYVACKEGHESVVTLLLNNGADPNVPNELTASSRKDFSLPLQIAVQRRNATVFNMLLENGAKIDHAGEPLLHIACSSVTAALKAAAEGGEARPDEHTLSMIKHLLQQGVNVNAISAMGDIALYRACVIGHLQVVQVLLEAGADANLTSKRRYPLIAACNAGNVELINVLVRAGADVKCHKNDNKTCLHIFINSCLLTTGIGPQEPVSKLDIENTIKLLLERGVDVNACCSSGETALYRASKAGHEHIVRLLLEAGADTAGSTSRRPLYAACERGYTQIVDLLLQHGADPNASTSTVVSKRVNNLLSSFRRLGVPVARMLNSAYSSQCHDLPVCCAVKKGYTDIVELLMKYGADANKKDQSGKSALIYSVETLSSGKCKTSNAEDPLEEKNCNIFKCLLLAAGDVNKLSDHDGRNALHIASSFGMCDVIIKLIERGANSNQLTSRGKSALDLACENGHEAAVEILLKNGAKPDRESATTYRQSSYDSRKSAIPVLCTAANNDSESMVQMLVQYGADVNASDKNANTALHLATSQSIMETLLNAGANVNAKNNNGATALSIVCKKRQIDRSVVEMLLRYGANPNVGFLVVAACTNNDLDTVQLLMAYGADANRPRKSWMLGIVGGSPLCIACKNGNVAMVDCLLQNGADTTFTDSTGNSSLHLAVQRLKEQTNSEEYYPIIALLLEHNAPINVVSRSGESPLYLACMKGLRGVVEQMLSYSFVGLTESSWNKYPLLIACQNKFSDIAMLLIERGAKTNVSKDNQTPLKVAAANGDVALVEKLITFEADLDQMQNVSDTALHAAVRQCKNFGDKALVVHMLLKGGAAVNVFNDRGETPLCLACRPTGDAVNIDIVRTLLEYGADPNICPPCCNSTSSSLRYNALPLLSSAAHCGNSELVLLLIKFGAKLNYSNECGETALHFAIGYDEMEFAQRLKSTRNCTSTVETLLSAGAEVNVLDRSGASPLFLACKEGKSELVNLLLGCGADPNKGIIDKLPIHAACRGQHYDSVKLLLEYKADVTACDKNGKTALHHAVESESHFASESDSDKRAALVQLLLEGGANVNAASQNGESPIYIVCSKGLTSIAKNMLEFGAVVDMSKGRKLPLIAACINSHTQVVQILLAHGADPEPKEGDIPLHIAARAGNSALVQLLLKYGANVDVANGLGYTALHLAIQRYYPKSSSRYSNKAGLSIDILLENKADVNKLNSDGETPLYVAVAKELLDVVCKMLQIYGGNPNAGSAANYPLVVACLKQKVKLVDMLLNHGADPNLGAAAAGGGLRSSLTTPLFVAADKGNSDIITSLLNAGASVNATDCEGRNAVCSAAVSLSYYHSESETNKRLSAIRLLLQHGANFHMLSPDGTSPLRMMIRVFPTALERGGHHKACVLELLQVMIEHGAVLLDSFFQLQRPQPQDVMGQALASLDSETLQTLATFDGKHKFIVNLFRAGAGFRLIAFCCSASSGVPRSIVLCQAAVLAGYVPSAEELVRVQLAADSESVPAGLMKQLMTWLNEDRQQVPSLFRQCRIVIRRQLSAAAQYRTILPAIDQLPLPNKLKLYLQFDGSLTEVDLTVNDEEQPQTTETTERTSTENRQRSLAALQYFNFTRQWL